VGWAHGHQIHNDEVPIFNDCARRSKRIGGIRAVDNSKPVMKPVMMRALALTFSMLTGVVAATGVDRLKAHGNSLHGYAIIEIDGVMDQGVLQDVLTRTSSVAASFGGRTITEAGSITGRDAVPPNKVILIAFDSIEDAEAWSTSAAEAELDRARDKAAKARSFLVDEVGSR
jgi:uncharacterized protein (DUF1330 family)